MSPPPQDPGNIPVGTLHLELHWNAPLPTSYSVSAGARLAAPLAFSGPNRDNRPPSVWGAPETSLPKDVVGLGPASSDTAGTDKTTPTRRKAKSARLWFPFHGPHLRRLRRGRGRLRLAGGLDGAARLAPGGAPAGQRPLLGRPLERGGPRS